MFCFFVLPPAAVYGFDEMPEQFNRSVYEIFGGLKKKWPSLTTMAVLDWQTFPADLPLDIWVDEYADYGSSPSYLEPTPKEKLRQTWGVPLLPLMSQGVVCRRRSGESRRFWVCVAKKLKNQVPFKTTRLANQHHHAPPMGPGNTQEHTRPSLG